VVCHVRVRTYVTLLLSDYSTPSIANLTASDDPCSGIGTYLVAHSHKCREPRPRRPDRNPRSVSQQLADIPNSGVRETTCCPLQPVRSARTGLISAAIQRELRMRRASFMLRDSARCVSRHRVRPFSTRPTQGRQDVSCTRDSASCCCWVDCSTVTSCAGKPNVLQDA
jgi:hypothetical protein